MLAMCLQTAFFYRLGQKVHRTAKQLGRCAAPARLGSLEANSTKKLIEIVYDLLIEAIQLGSLVMLKFGVGSVGLK